jgi:hypothetical protein
MENCRFGIWRIAALQQFRHVRAPLRQIRQLPDRPQLFQGFENFPISVIFEHGSGWTSQLRRQLLQLGKRDLLLEQRIEDFGVPTILGVSVDRHLVYSLYRASLPASAQSSTAQKLAITTRYFS